MKLIAAYYLLFFYAAALFKPVMPLLTDFLAHEFAHHHHMANVHQKHGENHMHKELAEATDEQDDQQQAKQKLSEPVSLHTFSKHHFEFFYWLSINEYHTGASPGIGKPPLQVIIPPPKNVLPLI